jgi:hypothetical protein
LLARQTEWQQARRSLSWAEKIRMVEAIRDSILQIQTSRARKVSGSADSEDKDKDAE